VDGGGGVELLAFGDAAFVALLLLFEAAVVGLVGFVECA